jgi:hypothetical protein
MLQHHCMQLLVEGCVHGELWTMSRCCKDGKMATLVEAEVCGRLRLLGTRQWGIACSCKQRCACQGVGRMAADGCTRGGGSEGSFFKHCCMQLLAEGCVHGGLGTSSSCKNGKMVTLVAADVTGSAVATVLCSCARLLELDVQSAWVLAGRSLYHNCSTA